MQNLFHVKQVSGSATDNRGRTARERKRTGYRPCVLILAVFAALMIHDGARASDAQLQLVREAEQRRIDVINRVAPSVVCIFDDKQRGGGSGVIIDEDGYGLTNFHVVAGFLDTRRGLGGLSDGKTYELHVLGIDPTGDVAMFQLVGKDRFDAGKVGDSDAVAVGDRAIAMGNPFILADDFTPTVTMGLVTGVHRYQWGQGNALVYSDCIQTDTPINPGNSGGPLFNEDGEVIGINGRISVNTRGRFNVGFGYAISANQIKRFMPSLRAGLLAHHGTLQATVAEDAEGRSEFNAVMKPGPAWDAGVRLSDKLVSFAGRPIAHRNDLASLIGAYPTHWTVPLGIKRDGELLTLPAVLEPLPVRMEQPFQVNQEINRRAVRRVIESYQSAMLGAPSSREREPWFIQVQRYRAEAPDAGAFATRDFTETSRGSFVLVERFTDGGTSAPIKFDGDRASQEIVGSDDEFDLPVDRRMPLCAMYAVFADLLSPVEQIDLSRIAHVGTDGAYESVADGKIAEQVLEVIQMPIARHAQARIAFDVNTGLPRRITAEDSASGERAVIEFHGWTQRDGRAEPAYWTIERRGAVFRDVVKQWGRAGENGE